jgi:hypothetical protein
MSAIGGDDGFGGGLARDALKLAIGRVWAAQHDGERVHRARLGRERGKDAVETDVGGHARIRAHDQQCVNSGGHDVVSLGGSRRRTRTSPASLVIGHAAEAVAAIRRDA